MNATPERLLTTTEAAEALRLSTKQLEHYRGTGEGPPYIKLAEAQSGSVRYRLSDLKAWLDGRRRTSTRAKLSDSQSVAA